MALNEGGAAIGAATEHEAPTAPKQTVQHVRFDLGKPVRSAPGKTTPAAIDAAITMAREDGRVVVLHDEGGKQSIPGLTLRIGRRTAAWVFFRDVVKNGTRQNVYETIGRYDLGTRDENPIRAPWHMSLDDARAKASTLLAKVNIGPYKPASSRAVRKFKDAFADYVAFLEDKAADNDKPAAWAKGVQRLGNKWLLPQWGEWSLREMSEQRAEVATWYRKISPGRTTSANHCIRIIRAIYLREANSDDTLSTEPSKLPSAPVYLRTENWKKRNVEKPGMAAKDFPAWAQKWCTLPAIRRSYHLAGLLTGARPGELARTPWSNLDFKSRTLTIGGSKLGADIPIPLSAAILRAIKIARDAQRASGVKSELIWPGCDQAGHREPLFSKGERGHSHRRTWKTVATDLDIRDENSALVLGHVPPGQSAKYAIRKMLLEGKALRKYQRDVSRAMLGYFDADPTLLRLSVAPSPREVAQAQRAPIYRDTCERHGEVERSTATGRCKLCVVEKNARQKPKRDASRKRNAA